MDDLAFKGDAEVVASSEITQRRSLVIWSFIQPMDKTSTGIKLLEVQARHNHTESKAK